MRELYKFSYNRCVKTAEYHYLLEIQPHNVAIGGIYKGIEKGLDELRPQPIDISSMICSCPSSASQPPLRKRRGVAGHLCAYLER